MNSKLFVRPLLLRNIPLYVGRRNKPDPCKKYVKVSHCIFNLDGAILDNHEMIHKAHRAIVEKHGKQYTLELTLKMMGMSEKALWDKVTRELNLDVPWGVLYEEFEEIIAKSLSNAPLRPGVERLVDHLEKNEIPMAIATTSSEPLMEAKTVHIKKFLSKFTHVTCGDHPQIRKSKPHGDIYLLCAAYFVDKPDPRTCLVFEDTPVGVLAAMDACMQVVGIPCPPIPPNALRHADEVVTTLKDFQPHKYGMPGFPGQAN